LSIARSALVVSDRWHEASNAILVALDAGIDPARPAVPAPRREHPVLHISRYLFCVMDETIFDSLTTIAEQAPVF
jgi:hypothetical protein